jgi:ATP-binding cassette subfamily F protein uup
MDRLVDHLFVFEGDGEIRDFPGNYTLYRDWLKVNEKKGKDKWGELGKMKSEGVTTEAVAGSAAGKGNQKATANQKKATYNEKREFETLEKEMKDLEAEKTKLEESLGNIPFGEIQKASQRIGQISTLLSDKEMRWLELSELM